MSDLTSFSTQREVEANETEMANTCLDSCSAAPSAPLCSGSTRVDAEGAGDAVAPLHDTGSYFQVVVEKHRHKRSASCRRVYRFERGCGEYLRTAGDAREAACSRAARRPARAARTALAEVLALAGLLLRAPLAALLLVQRCALEVARDALGGCVRDVSDYALKPALAATFNAAAHPALVFAANAGHALRAATAPFVGMALDALEPLVRVLGAVRLVELHVYSPPPPPAHPI
ncbi:hypothetical protein K1T71_003604 [Dendrolimus kikuchii]|uniref:Uncharacterized protein n=1 Tax=Dendrolimus kikuchii TaxID=765133 RepID=A0ACC1D8N9_9NEOP|nr:hypothetical protein K1T71_003604 [Dendrolimus kikuchii]